MTMCGYFSSHSGNSVGYSSARGEKYFFHGCCRGQDSDFVVRNAAVDLLYFRRVFLKFVHGN